MPQVPQPMSFHEAGVATEVVFSLPETSSSRFHAPFPALSCWSFFFVHMLQSVCVRAREFVRIARQNAWICHPSSPSNGPDTASGATGLSGWQLVMTRWSSLERACYAQVEGEALHVAMDREWPRPQRLGASLNGTRRACENAGRWTAQTWIVLLCSRHGYGSINHQGTAGFGPCFHLPGFHFGTGF